jgi:4-alpha-glucanotransferase
MIRSFRRKMKRGAGVLMPISALPSPYGIGTLGEECFQYLNFLKRIGCSYWQVLPIGPTGFGDSPYQSFSAFAGNPYFIDLDLLAREGLLEPAEYQELNWQKEEDAVHYAYLYQNRFSVLKKAFRRSQHQNTKEFKNYQRENSYWLRDYSLFMAVKEHFQSKEWSHWEENIRYRTPEAVERYTELLRKEIDFWEFCQYKFHIQWQKVKAYANQLGIQIIGDIPLYVAQDSSDVWSHEHLFELDERKRPIHVAGVPPDVFSEKGQRWGNPLYRWEAMEAEDFSWWRERMKMASKLYDLIRIDHFIGIANYYSIPASAKTAAIGKWKPGPGRKLTDSMDESVGSARIIAENLGILSPRVKELLEYTGYPGMKILISALDGPPEHDYLPHNYKSTNTVVYIGTHDNETLVGFLNNKTEEELTFSYRYFNVSRREELPDAIIRELYSSIADLVIVQMQDLLKLDNKARMNCPSTIGGNWQWRMKKSQYQDLDERILSEYAQIYTRI